MATKQRIKCPQEKLHDWLYDRLELILTTEGLKDEAAERGILRIAYYGSDCDYGETVFIGSFEECLNYAKGRGYHES